MSETLLCWHTQSHTQTPEKLLPDCVIQTFTPTEVERSAVDSRLRSVNVEQQVKETLYATARDAAERNRNCLWAERNGLNARVSLGSHFGLTTTTEKSTKSQSLLLITFSQNAFRFSTNSLQVSDIRIDATLESFLFCGRTLKKRPSSCRHLYLLIWDIIACISGFTLVTFLNGRLF